MSAMMIAGLVFACVFGGALIGLFLTDILPADHLSTPSKDVVNIATAMIATLTALVIGLLVASAKSSFDARKTEFTLMTSQLILLDRTLAQYGPETGPARDLLRRIALERLRKVWPNEDAVDTKAIGQGGGIEALQGMLRGLSPRNDSERYLQSKSLQIVDEIAAARWLLFEQVPGAIQWPFLAIVVFWLMMIFVSFGLSAPRNATVITALFASALSVAGAIFLIIRLDQPYGGIIAISSAPLRTAIGMLGKP